MFPALCSLLWKELPPPAAIDSGVGFPDFWLVQREAGNDSFRDWRAVEILRGGPRKLFKAFGTVFGDRETRYPYTSFVYHGRGKEDLLSEGIWVLK